MTATNSKSAATNNVANQAINKAKNTVKESTVYVDFKNIVWMEASASGVVGIGFRVPTNVQSGSSLLAFVTLVFKGVVMDGFSFRELPGKKAGATYLAVLPPSRKYTKGDQAAFASMVGFSQDMRSNLVADVKAAWEVYCNQTDES